jgi:phage gp16-like protein
MFVDSKSHPGYYEMKSNDIWEIYDEYFKKYPHAYCEVTKTDKYIFENDTKQTIAMNMGHYLHKKANRILFKMMEEYLQTWWD